MGCDIHCYVEVKKNEKWEANTEKVFLNEPPFHINGITDIKFKPHPRIYRNYNLFSELANVRNYNKIPYIDQPRGLPSDVSEEVEKISDNWGTDGHSHSYLTLSELLSWNWNGYNRKDILDYTKILKTLGKPDDVRIVFWFDN
jgi:hypothetical protein